MRRQTLAFDGDTELIHVVDEPWAWPPHSPRARCGAWMYRKATRAEARRNPMCPRCAMKQEQR